MSSYLQLSIDRLETAAKGCLWEARTLMCVIVWNQAEMVPVQCVHPWSQPSKFNNSQRLTLISYWIDINWSEQSSRKNNSFKERKEGHMIILIKLGHKKNNYISLQSSVSKCVYCRQGGGRSVKWLLLRWNTLQSEHLCHPALDLNIKH